MCCRKVERLVRALLTAAALPTLCLGTVVAQDAKVPTLAATIEENFSTEIDATIEQSAIAVTSIEDTTPTVTEEAPLVPVPDPIGLDPAEIEVASFKGVTPGLTNFDEVQQAWGSPKEVRRLQGGIAQRFTVDPFERVEVTYFNDCVASIVIRFDGSFPAPAVAEQLGLGNVRPVLVSNELGEILGQAYPERGVLFGFAPAEELGQASMLVSQIILEPVTAEAFILRAETDLSTQLTSALSDLDQALQLEPENARAHWLRGRVLVGLGDYAEAQAASAEAVRLEPDNGRYRVLLAKALGLLGKFPEAMEQAQKAVDLSSQRPHVKAQALCLLGDLAASGTDPDYAGAIDYHMRAIQEADSLAANRHPAIRLVAKEVLVDAHLGAAHDVAWGDWKQKDVALARWLAQANSFAEDLVKNEGRSEELRFRVSTRALAACVGVQGKLDPEQWADTAIRTGKILIDATEDPLHKAVVQWDLGIALYDALQTYQMRNEQDTALKYGELAIDYLEQGEQGRRSPSSSYLLGRVCFRLGAIHAIRDEDHVAAVAWFDKALPLLEGAIADGAPADNGRHGETLVSMGVSYWEAQEQEKAVELTQRGLELMETAVEQGKLDASSLSVPYNNLASMHRQLGSETKAEEYQQMATRLESRTVQ